MYMSSDSQQFDFFSFKRNIDKHARLKVTPFYIPHLWFSILHWNIQCVVNDSSIIRTYVSRVRVVQY